MSRLLCFMSCEPRFETISCLTGSQWVETHRTVRCYLFLRMKNYYNWHLRVLLQVNQVKNDIINENISS